jgi:two-component system, chemotaxis family, protein-glutamate methylesterase/glutaminase
VPPALDIAVVGASAGGVEALRRLVAGIPEDHGGAIFVVLHVSSGSSSVLGDILDRAGPLPAATARHGEPVAGGRIYVAPPDRHLVLADGLVALSREPRENGHRPAIDPLFRSAARAFGRSVTGVMLSGTGDDGTAGLQAVVAAGGRALVQDPRDALYRDMPESALRHVEVDAVEPVGAIGALLATRRETSMAMEGRETEQGDAPHAALERGPAAPDEGGAAGLRCPECGGSLWEREQDGLLRYECRVGHAYSTESMLSQQGNSLENLLWSALGALEERADLLRRVSRRAGNAGNELTARSFARKADGVAAQAEALRVTLATGVSDTPDESGEAGHG